jgi:hypothetical protein
MTLIYDSTVLADETVLADGMVLGDYILDRTIIPDSMVLADDTMFFGESLPVNGPLSLDLSADNAGVLLSVDMAGLELGTEKVT